MRFLICALVALSLFAVTGFGNAPNTFGGGGGGVMDGSNWQTPSGSHNISVSATGNTLGWYDVEVTEGDNTGSTTEGVGHEDGGVDSTPKIDVGDQDYRGEGGKMQWKNPSGDWIDMVKKTPSPKPKDSSATPDQQGFSWGYGYFASPLVGVGGATPPFTVPGGPGGTGAFAFDDEMVGTLP